MGKYDRYLVGISSPTVQADGVPTGGKYDKYLVGINDARVPDNSINEPKPSAFQRFGKALPIAGSVLGGLAGGAGGTVLGLGVGGVPGAIGGATVGGATGEAARQILGRTLGEPSPQTGLEAAGEIGKEGVLSGVGEATGLTAARVAAKGVGPFARRALGFGKREMRVLGKQRANETGRLMYENKVVRPFRGSESTLLRAEELSKTSGKAIDEGLSALDEMGIKSFNPGEIAKSVYASLKPSYKGGAYETQKKIAEEIRDTILAHGKGPSTFKSAQSLKNTLQDLGKFESSTNQMKAMMYRRASSVVRKALEDSVENAAKPQATSTALALTGQSKKLVPNEFGIRTPDADIQSRILPETLSRYLQAKKLYGASESARKALEGRVAAESVNLPVSLPGTIVGASRLAAGDFPGVLASVGAYEALKRRGASGLAGVLSGVSRAKVPITSAIQTLERVLGQ